MALYAVMAVAQPVLAGRYLSGGYEAIQWHAVIGGLLMVGAIGAFCCALLHATVGRGPAWPVLAVTIVFLAQGVQIGMGYSRALAVHVPLGVGIVAAVLSLAVWVWTPAARATGRWWSR